MRNRAEDDTEGRLNLADRSEVRENDCCDAHRNKSQAQHDDVRNHPVHIGGSSEKSDLLS